jgi:hypothetical protein
LGAFDAKQTISEQGLLIAGEIRRARQYLSTLRLMGRDDQLHVLSLFDASFTEQLPLVLHELKDDAEQVHLEAQSGLPMLIQKLKLPSCCSTWHDVLVASLLNLKVRNHYAPPEMLRYGRLYRIGRGMQWAALSIIGLGLILSGIGLWQGDEIQQQLALSNTQIQREQSRLRELNQKLKLANAENPAQIQAAVELYRRDLQSWPSAEAAAKQFSHIFVDFPRLILEKFEWQAGGMMPAAPEMQDPSAETALPRGAQQWTITGRVINPAAYRQALADVNQLAEQLRQLPSATVQILKHPLDIRPEAAVNAQATEANEKMRIDFIVQVTLAAPAIEKGDQQ